MERPLTGRFRADGAAPGIDEYERAGGYRALRRVLTTLTPRQVIEEVTAANLFGRGGAGFPAGKKWSGVPEGAGECYLVANADEMEPGAFKDRALMEGDPHQFVEGMIIAAYAVGARTAYIFLRAEYRESELRLRRAIAEARARGYLGPRILGGGYGLELHLHLSAGRYLCGEASALLNALEGRRPIPRTRLPRATTAGLWGRPTVVNNVETLCNVPHIIARGARWFLDLSRAPEGRHGKGGGTKIFAVSGRVRRPGWFELPMGTPLREIIEGHAGGMREGYALRAVQPGGGSTPFLGAERLDVAMDFDSCEAAGSRLGTGTAIVLDDRTCPVGALLVLERFFARESCGWCTPCRDGLPWSARLLEAIENGRGSAADLDILRLHTRLLGPGNTFCAHAPGAMAPLESGLELFADDFARHLHEGRCPYADDRGQD